MHVSIKYVSVLSLGINTVKDVIGCTEEICPKKALKLFMFYLIANTFTYLKTQGKGNTQLFSKQHEDKQLSQSF